MVTQLNSSPSSLSYFIIQNLEIETGHPGTLNRIDVWAKLRLSNQGLGTSTYRQLSNWCIFIMPIREHRRTPASFLIMITEDSFSDSSTSPRDLSPLISETEPIMLVPARLNYLLPSQSNWWPEYIRRFAPFSRWFYEQSYRRLGSARQRYTRA